MTVIEITDFNHVIQRALQKRMHEDALKKTMTFNELWRAVEAAAPLLPGADSPLSKTDVARSILWETETLEESGIVTRLMRGKKLSSITLTEFGEQHLRSVVFAHQERAPG